MPLELALNSGMPPGSSVMPGLGNDGPGAAGNTVLPLKLRDGRNSAPALNVVAGVVRLDAMKAPRFCWWSRTS